MSRSVALAAMITPLIRCSLPSAPMFAYTAPEAGTGKSLLTDINSILMCGTRAAVIGQGYGDKELEKRIDSALIAGQQMIAIDNCDRQLQSDVLCQVLTQSHRSVRILGLSKSITAPTNVNVNCNGNNLMLGTDLIRRSLLCTIDAKLENPSKRKFPWEPIQYVTRHRARLVVAALTIVRAYQISNRKVALDTFGSFETWSGRVREALVWLGLEDPCGSQDKLRERDIRKGSLASVMTAWKAHPELGRIPAYGGRSRQDHRAGTAAGHHGERRQRRFTARADGSSSATGRSPAYLAQPGQLAEQGRRASGGRRSNGSATTNIRGSSPGKSCRGKSKKAAENRELSTGKGCPKGLRVRVYLACTFPTPS